MDKSIGNTPTRVLSLFRHHVNSTRMSLMGDRNGGLLMTRSRWSSLCWFAAHYRGCIVHASCRFIGGKRGARLTAPFFPSRRFLFSSGLTRVVISTRTQKSMSGMNTKHCFIWSKGEIERLQQPHGNSLPHTTATKCLIRFPRFGFVVLVCYASAGYPLNNLWEVDVCKI